MVSFTHGTVIEKGSGLQNRIVKIEAESKKWNELEN